MSTDPEILIAKLLEKNIGGEKLKFLGEDKRNLQISRTGENGVMNAIYRVKSSDGAQSVIMKIASTVPMDETLATLSISLGRQDLEYECLKTLNQILPGCAPEAYHFDKELHIIVMEDLGSMDPLSTKLQNGEFSVDIATDIGRTLSYIHKKTHRKMVTPETWKDYEKRLSQRGQQEMIFKLRTEFMLEDGFLFEIREEWADKYKDWNVEIREKKIFEKLKELYHHDECLTHNDFHYHAIFASDKRIAMFDLEFGGLGNQSWAIGTLIAFYVFALVESQDNAPDRKQELRDAAERSMRALYTSFISGYGDLVHLLGPLDEFLPQMAGFAAIAFFSFSLCVTHACFFTINPSNRCRLAELAMHLLREMENYKTFDKLLEDMFSLV